MFVIDGLVKSKYGLLVAGLISGFLLAQTWAATAPPTSHVGLDVEKLGAVPANSIKAQIALAERLVRAAFFGESRFRGNAAVAQIRVDVSA